MVSAVAQKLMDDETDARLINWGKWANSDTTYQKLDYPNKAPFTVEPVRGSVVNELDGFWIAEIVSTLYMADLGRSRLYAFVLKVEYVDYAGEKKPHVSQRAEDVRRRFRRPCAESTYYQHLTKAKRLVQYLAGPIV